MIEVERMPHPHKAGNNVQKATNQAICFLATENNHKKQLMICSVKFVMGGALLIMTPKLGKKSEY